MIYKFKSKASGDIVMLGADGDELLRSIGREPAPQGIIEPQAMAAVIARLEAAVAASDGGTASGSDDEQPVKLRQRAWPMLDMLKRSLAEQQPIVWGV